jgi:hypothetical protein
MLIEYIIWLGVFISVFFVSYILLESKMLNYETKIILNTLYYWVSIIILYAFIRNKISTYLHLDLLALGLLLVCIIMGYQSVNIINKTLPIPKKILKQKNTPYFFKFTRHFIFTKLSDILFQQLMILWLIQMLISEGFTSYRLMIFFTIIFTLFHIPTIIKHKWFSLFFIISALFGGMIVPWIIINLELGIIYSILLHWSIYFFGRIYYGIYYLRHPVS